MERIHQNSRSGLGECQNNTWLSVAYNYWVTQKVILCHSCSITFHHKWPLKISKNKEFIEASFRIINDLIKKLEEDGKNFRLVEYFKGFNEFVEEANNNYNKLHEKFSRDGVNFINKDYYIEELKSLINNVFESQAYICLI